MSQTEKQNQLAIKEKSDIIQNERRQAWCNRIGGEVPPPTCLQMLPPFGQVSLTFLRITMRTFITTDEININGEIEREFSWFLFFSYPQGNRFYYLHKGCDFPPLCYKLRHLG